MLTAIPITPTDFLSTLTPQILVVTPNRRLATRLRQGLLHPLEHGQSRIAPTILAYQDWLTQTQQQLHLHGKTQTQLLDTTAMDWVFTKTLPQDITLLSSPERLATTAKQAWQLAHEGCLPWQQLKQHPHLDYQWFTSWAERVKALLDAEHYTDSYYFAYHHIDAIAQATKARYTQVFWYGFMDFSPLQQRLQQALGDNGCAQSAYVAVHPTALTQPIQLMQAPEPQQELQVMLQHAKAMQAEGKGTIACVVPQLASQRAKIVTEVWRCFEPDAPWPHYRKDAPVNISGGYYLSELAPTQTAVALISLWQKDIPYETLASLLLSPYWGHINDPSALADVERLLRQAVATHLPLASWLRLLPDNHAGAAHIQNTWQPIVNQARQLPKHAYPSHWVTLMKQQLLALHWPGPKALDSWHYQVAQALLQQLEQLAGYDALMGSLSLPAMLQLWQTHLAQQLFQAETGGQAVEILGTLEATGLTWDSLWVCQLQAHDFPEAPKPNPLLPLAWQQAAGLPHTDAKREHDYAQTLLDTWQSQAGQLTFSYSLHIDGLPAEGSMLLEPFLGGAASVPGPAVIVGEPQAANLNSVMPAGSRHPYTRDGNIELFKTGGLPGDPLQERLSTLPKQNIDPFCLIGPVHGAWIAAPSRNDNGRDCRGSLAMTALEPIREYPIPKLEGTLKGGSYHLHRFLECPFKAFGYHRLGAEALAQKSMGLSPMQRGQAVHRCLQLIWQQLGSQQALIALDEAAQDSLIHQAITSALHPWQQQLPAVIWTQQLAWLTQVVHAWLAFERTRAPFDIHSLEQAHTLDLGGVTIKLRSDRIDRYADGAMLVIDYKTGIAQVSESFKAPLSAPQMPLYLLAIAAENAGFAYVTLKPGKVGWDGVSDTIPEATLKSFTDVSHKVLGEPKAYSSQLATWQTELETLTLACANNQATLNPRAPEACRYCDLASLCRRDELITG